MSITAYHFWSPTCGPCKVIKPAIEDLKEEFPIVNWITVNTHDDPEKLVSIHGVKIVPTIVVIAYDDNGQVILSDKYSGTVMAGYYRILRNAYKTII
jgi:thiol-disulfide isomerase/thioredoxin